MLRFLFAVSITALLMWGGGYLVFEQLPVFFYQSIILLVVSTVGLYRFLINTKQNKPDLFVPLYLGTLALKLIAYGAYVFVMVQQQPEMAAENVVFFMVGYVIFTGLETVFLYRYVNR